MGWIKIDDGRADHPKLLAAGLAARGLDEAAICWSSSHLTDGLIPEGAVAMLCAGHGERNWRKLAAKLVEVGRWVPTEGGWEIHGYLDWQRSRQQVEAERDATKRRVKRHRNGVTNAEGNAGCNDTQKQKQITDPVVVSAETHDPPEPKPDDDDTEAKIGLALTLLATRDLERRQAEKGQVGDRAAWLRVAAQARSKRHAGLLASLPASQLAAMDAATLAEFLDPQAKPPGPELRHYDVERVDCERCEGSGWVDTEDGFSVRCSCVRERIEA